MLFGRVADAHWMLLKLTLDACLDASRMRSGCVPDALDAFGCFRMLSDALDAVAHFPILDYYVGCFFVFLCFLLLFVFVCFVIFRLNVFCQEQSDGDEYSSLCWLCFLASSPYFGCLSWAVGSC